VKHMRHGKVTHIRASQATASLVMGKVVTSTLCVASVADGCFTLHCSLHQRFDVNLQTSFLVKTSDMRTDTYIQLFYKFSTCLTLHAIPLTIPFHVACENYF